MNYLALEPAQESSRWPWVEFRRVAAIRRQPNSRSNKTLLSLSAESGIRPRPDDGGRQLPSPETVSRYWVVHPDDLVFNPMWAIEGGVAVSEIGGAVSTAYRVYDLTGSLFPRYAHYYFRSDPALAQYRLMVRGITTFDRSITRESFEAMPVPLPSVEEQRAIADYLDTETNRIDTLITKKRRMIKLLEQRLVALATRLVTGEGESQASGIPSIPYIPRRWQVLRNKVFMREVNERSTTGTEELLSVSHLTGVTPRSQKTVYMFKAESMVGYKLVRPGDLAVNTMWAWMGAAGVSRHRGIVSPSYGVYRIDQSTVLSAYFDLLIRTPAYVCEMTRYSRGVTSSRLRLYPEELLALRTPVPPIDVQYEIVRRFEDQADKARAAVDALVRQVEVLGERRQALITAAVTGELAVPSDRD